MNLFLCLMVPLSFVVAGPLGDAPQRNVDLLYKDDIDLLFDRFKAKYGKKYESPAKEEFSRQIFKANVNYIRHHNRQYLMGEQSFYLGVNGFTDLSVKEFVKISAGSQSFTSVHKGSPFVPRSNDPIPDAVDWRKKGYVTYVRNQLNCASDWAFSTTGTLEGQLFKHSGKLIPLSAQQLMDCSGNFSNYGCLGGLPINAYQYISAAGGIESEEDYPYEAKEDTCRFNKSRVVVDIFGWVETKSGDEVTLQQACALDGPMSVRIDSSHISFQLYSGGIYNEPNCSSTELCHAVLLVGYSTNPDYWIVKNSWGADWGEEGYIRMSRNKNNQCGIATNASYPMV